MTHRRSPRGLGRRSSPSLLHPDAVPPVILDAAAGRGRRRPSIDRGRRGRRRQPARSRCRRAARRRDRRRPCPPSDKELSPDDRPSTSFTERVHEGHASRPTCRFRYEFADIDGFDDSQRLHAPHAAGLRHRRRSAGANGLHRARGRQLGIDDNLYNAAGLNNEPDKRSVIADPEDTELNQLYLKWVVPGDILGEDNDCIDGSHRHRSAASASSSTTPASSATSAGGRTSRPSTPPCSTTSRRRSTGFRVLLRLCRGGQPHLRPRQRPETSTRTQPLHQRQLRRSRASAS